MRYNLNLCDLKSPKMIWDSKKYVCHYYSFSMLCKFFHKFSWIFFCVFWARILALQVNHILNHQMCDSLNFVQPWNFKCLHKVSCNKCCEISFIFNVLWCEFVLVLLIGLILCCFTTRLVSFIRFFVMCFTQGLIWLGVKTNVVCHVGCVFACEVATSRNCI